ncbi:uncharacterized protein LOC122509402 isoform X2 [Leptopilina heterotoma]|uniref:uncharacterized protein LOC122509402 isoform X2 n=1 Tax=Leptopilina heterotoma TaxID=63436 RepID=UPI001CA9444D|nr:uncharacterized protein LOC122509402 isoform X2 [Leptopilina heterotoma]
MKMVSAYYFIIIGIISSFQVFTYGEIVQLSGNGPVVLGGSITFRADIYNKDGSKPHSKYRYQWSDNALYNRHQYTTEPTKNTTIYYTVSYPESEGYVIGIYEMEVLVSKEIIPYVWYQPITSRRIEFEVSQLLNGNLSIVQSNKTTEGIYVSSEAEANVKIDIRDGDLEFLKKKATSISTFWFVDCKYFGQTVDFSFKTNFTKVNTTHNIEALIVASFEPPTTPAPITTTSTTTVPTPSNTTVPSNSTKPISDLTTPKPVTTTTMMTTTTISPNTSTIAPNATQYQFANISFPFVCLNSSIIPPDPKKTYGYFNKEITVKAPINKIVVEGTNWIQPWEMLSLNVSCTGSGPFYKCLAFHRGKYNITGNETCYQTDILPSCNFSIIHYFLEPSVSTIVMIIKNDVSTQIYPLTINIYSATVQPQLSVIVVPVACSLVAIVSIIFGIAYYIQNRARFTVEVADFDFGKSNPDMEYKTFRERLRDSFNNAGYKPLHDSQILQ